MILHNCALFKARLSVTLLIMRTVLLALLCLGSVAAHASFEMMLYGDNSSAISVVQRCDPISGTYLGSFGKNFIPGPIYGIAVNQSAGEAYVLTSGRVSRFDYSTGEFRGAFIVSGGWTDIAYNPSVGRITLGEGNGSGNSGATNQFTPSGTAVGLVPAGGYISSAPIYLDATRSVAFTLSSAYPYYISTSLYDFGSSSPIVTASSSIAWASTNGIRQAVYTNGSLYGVMYDAVAGQVRAYKSQANTVSVTAPNNVYNISTPASANPNIALGHGGNIYVRNGSSVWVYNDPTNATMGTFTLPVGTAANIRGMAVVVAPEPTTWLGLAVGVAILIRRRKR